MGLSQQPVFYSYLKDAPKGGTFYGRQSGAWVAGVANSLAENSVLLGNASNEPAAFATGALGRALLDDADAATARTTLGLGTVATQDADSIAITGGSISGITDLAIADGGTGASTAAAARTALGLAIGTNVQAYNAGLADVAGLAVADGNFIVGDGSNWVAESGATVRTSLGLGTMAEEATGDYWERDATATWTGAHEWDGGSTPSTPSSDKVKIGNGVIKPGTEIDTPTLKFSSIEFDAPSLALPQAFHDHGRFAGNGRDERGLDNGTDPFAAGAFFNSQNSSTFAEAGKFIHDNTDNGGSAGSMTSTTNDLMTAMGRGSDRYGVEFRICEITCGAGTTGGHSIGGETLYLLSTNGSKPITGQGDFVTLSYWLRATGGNIGIRAFSPPNYMYIDGAYQSSDYSLAPADGWVHIHYAYQVGAGYDNALPFFYGANGRTAQIAVPVLCRGFVHPNIHTAPILSPHAEIS